jgi:hypothetical protein
MAALFRHCRDSLAAKLAAADVPPTNTELLLALDRRVAALRTSRPDLADALDLQQTLIRATLESARAPIAQPFALPREQVAARIREGVPLLHDQPVQIDIHFAADLFSRIVNALQQRGAADLQQRGTADVPQRGAADLQQPGDDADLQPRLNSLVDAATGGLLDPHQLFTEAFVQHDDHLAELASSVAADPELLIAVARQAAAPLLRAFAERLVPLVERADEPGWTSGYCPICGAWPLLDELRGTEPGRFSRCAGCGTGWRARGLGCPYCGNDDARSLHTLTMQTEPRFRVSACDRCHGYLKIANTFDPAPSALLQLDDVASRHLDVAAIERGYHRPGGAGFTIELAVPEEEWADELA